MKKFLIMVICAPLMACANPDYVGKTNKAESQPSKCDVYFKKVDACATIHWINLPAKSQDSKFQLNIVSTSNPEFTDKVNLADLNVILWMPSMGHGSSPTAVQKIEQGAYDVSNVYFIMSGDWEIRFELKNGSEILDQAIYAIEI